MESTVRDLQNQVEQLQTENWRMGARLDGLLQLCVELAKASRIPVTPERYPLLWQVEPPAQQPHRSGPFAPDAGSNGRHSDNTTQSQISQRGQNSNSSHKTKTEESRMLTFKYTADHDRSGVVYWLGTGKGTAQWQNPQEIGAVSVIGHRVARGQPRMVVDHRFSDQVYYTDDNPDSHVTIDLKSVLVRPTTYTISHRAKVAKFFLRSWTLSASVDGQEWTTICRHENDPTLNTRRMVASFEVDEEGFYRMFRVTICPHGNSERTSALVISCFEIYGDVMEN